MKTFARRNRVRRPGASSLSVATLLFVFAVVVGPLLTGAQEAGKVRWIGVLRITPELTWMEALRGGLRDLGYVEGQQIGIIDRLAEEKSHRLPDLAAELVRLKVDVIVTSGSDGGMTA